MVATGGAKTPMVVGSFVYTQNVIGLDTRKILRKDWNLMKSPPEHLKEMFNCRMQGTSNAMFHWVFCWSPTKLPFFSAESINRGLLLLSRKIDERFNEESIPMFVTQLWTIGIVGGCWSTFKKNNMQYSCGELSSWIGIFLPQIFGIRTWKKVYPPGNDHASHPTWKRKIIQIHRLKHAGPDVCSLENTFETHDGFKHHHVREAQKGSKKKHLCSRHRATSRSCVESKVKPVFFGFTKNDVFWEAFKSRSWSGKQGGSTCMCVYIYMKVSNLI